MCKDFIPKRHIIRYSVCKYCLLSSLLLLMTVSLSPANVAAVDDDYLRALEIEAEKSALVSKKPKSTNSKSKPAASADKKEFKQFEQAMQSRRPAIYRFYKKLDTEEKSIIFSIYQEDHKFTRASKVVFDLYFDQKK